MSEGPKPDIYGECLAYDVIVFLLLRISQFTSFGHLEVSRNWSDFSNGGMGKTGIVDTYRIHVFMTYTCYYLHQRIWK